MVDELNHMVRDGNLPKRELCASGGSKIKFSHPRRGGLLVAQLALSNMVLWFEHSSSVVDNVLRNVLPVRSGYSTEPFISGGFFGQTGSYGLGKNG